MQDAKSDASPAKPGATGRTTVYFDGSCALCSVEIGYYASLKGGERLCFVDASRGDVALGDGLEQGKAMRRFHVRLPDGSLTSGARGLVAVWENLAGWRWAARIARLPGVIHALEIGYRLFLPIRPALSRIAARLGAKPASGRNVRS